MKNPLIYILFVSFTFCNIIRLPAQEKQLTETEIAAVQIAISSFKAKYDVPALSIGITKNGQTIFINEGTYSREDTKPVNEHTQFQIASVSKPLTGILINQLILDGYMDAQSSICKYLPADYHAKTLAKLESITVRDLLHHRSGLRSDSKLLRKHRKGNQALDYIYTAADFKKELRKAKLKSTPGSTYRYSNWGFALLGYLAENATGETYEDLLQRYVFEPNNMKNSTSLIQTNNDLATAYRKDKRHIIIEPWRMGKLCPPSGLVSSAADLMQLAQRQMLAMQSNKPSALKTNIDYRISHPEVNMHYGYGIRVFEDGKGVWHGGEMDGFACFYSLHPKSQTAHVIMSSCNGDELFELSAALSKILFR